VGLAVLHIRAEAADARHDRLAALGMATDFARQREQAERAGEIDILGCESLRQAGALGFRAVGGLAELHVGAEAARAQRDFEAGNGVLAELLQAGIGGGIGTGAGRELARIAALGIIGTADEAAELAELEREPPGGALRTLARIAAV